MPSSQPQQISKIIEYILDINPQSLLEIGVGFGKYGMLCREYLEYWNGDINWRLPIKENWKRRIDGIEAFEPYLNVHHDYLYSNIYKGNALDVLDNINSNYDLILLIDVLEHFNYSDGMKLLKKCIQKSKNILISVPKDIGQQGDVNDNEYETHRFQFLKKHFSELDVEYSFSSGGASSLVVLLGEDSKNYSKNVLTKTIYQLRQFIPGYWIRRRYLSRKLRKK